MNTPHTRAALPAHTAGPWHINTRGFIVDSAGAIVTRMECSECGADAALVAAAPELLAALEAVLSFKYPQWKTGKWDDLAPVKQARAALDKAKGIQ